MKMYRFPENKAWKTIFGFFLFAMLLLARDTLITSSILGFYKSTFIMYAAIGLMGVAFLAVNRKNLKQILFDRRMLLVIVATVVLVVPMLVKRDWQMMYFSILLCIYFAVFLSYFVTMQEVAKLYVVILSALSVYAVIVTYGARFLAEAGVLEVPMFSNGVHDFYNFLFGFAIDCGKWKNIYYRNFGIFREPGVYQFFIIVALYLNNYIVSWKKSWQMWVVNVILAITMLTTFATGGIIEMGLLAVILFIDKKWYKDKRISILVGAAVAAVVVFMLYSVAAQNVLYRTIRQMVMKLFNFDPSSTGGVRYQAIIVDLKIFLQNPIFGEKLAATMFAGGREYTTNSTVFLFAAFGLFAGLLHTISWIALVWQKDRKIWVNLALLLVLFMSFNTEEMTADIFFWLFPVMALVEKGLPLVKFKKLKKKA